ncbi:hypothetical protein [Kaarinaea lacus]
MKKLTLVAPLILALPTTGFSADAKTAMQNLKASGFVDVVYVLSDSTDENNNNGTGDSTIDKKFSVSGELDLETELNPRTAMRMDLDLTTGITGGNPNEDTPDSAIFEQAFIDYSFDNNMKLKAGVFNNRFSFEKEDAPDLYQVTHSQLWDIWQEQTALNGNNLAGLEFSANVGIVTLIAGLLNDRVDTPEEISFELGAEIKAMESMDIVVGLISADEGTAIDNNAGTIIDANITWKWEKLMVGGGILTADEIYDLGMQATGNYAFTDNLSGTARIDYVSYEGDFDSSTSLTLAALFAVDKNLYANAEIRIMQNDDHSGSPAATRNPNGKVGDGSMLFLEVLGTF